MSTSPFQITDCLQQNKILDCDKDLTAAELSYWGLEEGDLKEVILRKNVDSACRRPFQNFEQQTQTAQTRQLTPCVCCKMQRKRVFTPFWVWRSLLLILLQCIPDLSNPKGVCLTCQKICSMKITKLPCLRYRIIETRLFMPWPVPGLEQTQHWPDSKLVNITNQVSSDKKTIQTTDSYTSKTVTLEVCEFVPVKGDVLHIHWQVAGERKEVSVLLNALAKVAVAKQAYQDYTNKVGTEIFKVALKKKDKHILETYSIAIETSNNPKTVSTLFKGSVSWILLT